MDPNATPTSEAPEWHGEVPYLSENPDAGKAFSKYTDVNEAFKGAHEALKKIGEPYRLPKNVAKLSDEQRAEFYSGVAKLKGAPENPEGYDLKIPDGVTVDDEAVGEFKMLCHKQGKTKAEAQDMLNLQLAMVGRLNARRETAIKEMTAKNAEQFAKEVGGDQNAVLRTGWVKEYLQSKCFGEDGEPDKDVWEAFQKRIMFEDRIIELPLLRALSEAAQHFRGQGGAPMGNMAAAAPAGALSYPEMKK